MPPGTEVDQSGKRRRPWRLWLGLYFASLPLLALLYVRFRPIKLEIGNRGLALMHNKMQLIRGSTILHPRGGVCFICAWDGSTYIVEWWQK